MRFFWSFFNRPIYERINACVCESFDVFVKTIQILYRSIEKKKNNRLKVENKIVRVIISGVTCSGALSKIYRKITNTFGRKMKEKIDHDRVGI